MTTCVVILHYIDQSQFKLDNSLLQMFTADVVLLSENIFIFPNGLGIDKTINGQIMSQWSGVTGSLFKIFHYNLLTPGLFWSLLQAIKTNAMLR